MIPSKVLVEHTLLLRSPNPIKYHQPKKESGRSQTSAHGFLGEGDISKEILRCQFPRDGRNFLLSWIARPAIRVERERERESTPGGNVVVR